MAPVWQAPWSIYMVALLGQGAHAVAFMTVHNGSLTSARRQAYSYVHYPDKNPSNVGTLISGDTGCLSYGTVRGASCGSIFATTLATCQAWCSVTTNCDCLGLNTASNGCFRFSNCQTSTAWNDNIGFDTYVRQAGPDGGAAAVGDPHLQNVHGERFDLMKEGNHVLISIPRGQDAQHALLRVQADARRLGGNCADMYFKEVNVTGAWAEAKNAGGYHYSASQNDIEAPEWVAFGKVELKVVHGRTDGGLPYLNVYMKHLRSAGVAVGGLLGEDDHEDVITPPEACTRKMTLGKGQLSGQIRASASSVAMATFGE